MKAVVYDGPRKVSVKDVPDARIERPTDVLVRITTTNICGSDLHMYEGRTDFETGRWFGHENLGEVIEVGDGVDKVEGRRLRRPARSTSACGHCKNCERGLTNYCLTAQPEAGDGRGRLRLRRHGPLGRRPGRAAAGALRRLQLPAAARGRRGEADRLRDAGRHLPDRLPRHRAGRTSSRATSRSSTAPGPSGCMAAYSAIHQGREQGDGRRPAPRPAAAGRGDRRDPDRRLDGRPGRGGHRA